jgi:hypothetical protein
MPDKVIKAAGYGNVRTVRNIFYQRAKVRVVDHLGFKKKSVDKNLQLLYDLNTEKDHLCKATGAILLSYRFSPDDKQAGSIWLSVAIQNAMAIQAHRFDNLPLSSASRNRLKRLWWCIYLRDRIISLGLRRPMQINPSSFEHPSEVLTEDDFSDEVHASLVHDAETKIQFCHLMTSLCHLSIIMTDVLNIVHNPEHSNSPDQRLDAAAEAKGRLIEWHKNDNEAIVNEEDLDESNFSIVIFSNMTLMYYQ